MNNLTKALLQDLQEELNLIKNLKSSEEVAWELGKLAESASQTKRLIIKDIQD